MEDDATMTPTGLWLVLVGPDEHHERLIGRYSSQGDAEWIRQQWERLGHKGRVVPEYHPGRSEE